MSEANFYVPRPSTQAWSQAEPTPTQPHQATRPYPTAPNFYPPQPQQTYLPQPQAPRYPQQPYPPQYYAAPPQPVVIQQTVVVRRRAPHVLHFVLTLFTGGLWLPVWIIDTIRR